MSRPGVEADGVASGSMQLMRFAFVGGLGTVTNLAIFFLLVDRGSLAEIPGSVLCFAIAVTQNYALNELWAFRSAGRAELSLRRYLGFIGASLFGLGVNLVVLAGLLALYDFPLSLIPQAIGIGAGMFVNFVVSRAFVFARDDTDPD